MAQGSVCNCVTAFGPWKTFGGLRDERSACARCRTSSGRSSSSVGTRSILVSTSRPPTTLPNTVCLLSRWCADLYKMKNWEPLVHGPLQVVQRNR